MDYKKDFEITVDLSAVEKYVKSSTFIEFLTNSTNDLSIAAYCLDRLFRSIEEDRESVKEEEKE